MFLLIQNTLRLSFREWTRSREVNILSKLLPSSLAGIFRHYKLNTKSIYYWVSASDEIVICLATQNNLSFQHFCSIKKRKSIICDHSYVKNKEGGDGGNL